MGKQLNSFKCLSKKTKIRSRCCMGHSLNWSLEFVYVFKVKDDSLLRDFIERPGSQRQYHVKKCNDRHGTWFYDSAFDECMAF